MKKNYLLLSLLCSLFFTFNLQAQNTIYVNINATGANDGSSWANAFTDFQAGVNAASTGDNVWVAKGTYQPSAGQSFSMKEGVKIYGGFAGRESGLDQRDLGSENSSILKGNGNRVISNATNHLSAAAVLDGFTITGGSGSAGGGIYNNQSSPTIVNCIFSGNSSNSGGAGMYNYQSSPVITNCVFSGNKSASFASGVYNAESPLVTLINCVLSGNSSSSGGALVTFNSSTTITNSIIYGNNNGILNLGGQNPTITYSLVQGMSADVANHNLDGNTDPIFVSPINFSNAPTTSGDYSLQKGSPVVNVGNNGVLPAGVSTDLAGNPRVFDKANGGIVDLGAYEFIPIFFVNIAATGANDGSSWANAFTDFQAGVNAASAGEKVWVAKGTYQPASGQSFAMKEGVKIYGGFAGTETSLSQRDLASANNSILQGNGNRVVTNLNNGLTNAALLDGFTITDGHSTVNGGGMIISNGSPTIANCIFQGNTASFDGGGVFTDGSSPIIINSVFSQNTAINGGGLYLDNPSSPTLINVTITDNAVSSRGSGVYNERANSIITNCIIYNNTGGNAIDNFDNNSTNDINYSLVQGMAADPAKHNSDGTLSYDLFVNESAENYQLKSGSPCINTGNNATLPAGVTTDLAGNPRIANGTVDMGAYEYLGALPITLINFIATKDRDAVKLEWTTTSEINNKQFLILRSTDGSTYTEIGKVAGAGTTSIEKNYSFYDYNPANGINYYRLQQVDWDGHISEAGIQVVRFSYESSQIKVYPNPVENKVNILFTRGLYHWLEITDYSGRVLTRVTIGNGEAEKTLLLNGYPAGGYLVKLIGENVVTEKLIKK